MCYIRHCFSNIRWNRDTQIVTTHNHDVLFYWLLWKKNTCMDFLYYKLGLLASIITR
jgi:hypothetical protein